MRFRTLHKYLLIMLVMLITSISFMGFAALPANAMLVGTNGVQGAQIIAAPSDVTMNGAFNKSIQAFDEAAGVVLGSKLAVDGGFIDAGRRIASHMIFLNSPNGEPISAGFSKLGLITFNFKMKILGVMSDSKGLLEIASSYIPGTLTHFLGAEDTKYPVQWFYSRGLERTDLYKVDGKSIGVRMGVTNQGDWIRVVTASPVPLPGSVWALAMALGALGFWRLRRPEPVKARA